MTFNEWMNELVVDGGTLPRSVMYDDRERIAAESAYNALAARLAEAERVLREISLTSKGYPNGSREGEVARAYFDRTADSASVTATPEPDKTSPAVPAGRAHTRPA